MCKSAFLSFICFVCFVCAVSEELTLGGASSDTQKREPVVVRLRGSSIEECDKTKNAKPNQIVPKPTHRPTRPPHQLKKPKLRGRSTEEEEEEVETDTATDVPEWSDEEVETDTDETEDPPTDDTDNTDDTDYDPDTALLLLESSFMSNHIKTYAKPRPRPPALPPTQTSSSLTAGPTPSPPPPQQQSQAVYEEASVVVQVVEDPLYVSLPLASVTQGAGWFQGPQRKIPVSALISAGCQPCYLSFYGLPTSADVFNSCAGPYVFIGGIQVGASTVLLGAMIRSDMLYEVYSTTTTPMNTTLLINGTYWYFSTPPAANGYPLAFGFSAVRHISIEPGVGLRSSAGYCDLSSSVGAYRLCWNLNTDLGGFRLGTKLSLNASSPYYLDADITTYKKVVYNCPLTPYGVLTSTPPAVVNNPPPSPKGKPTPKPKPGPGTAGSNPGPSGPAGPNKPGPGPNKPGPNKPGPGPGP